MDVIVVAFGYLTYHNIQNRNWFVKYIITKNIAFPAPITYIFEVSSHVYTLQEVFSPYAYHDPHA